MLVELQFTLYSCGCETDLVAVLATLVWFNVITSLYLDIVSARMGVGHLLLPAQLPGSWNSLSDDLRDPTVSTDSFTACLKLDVAADVQVSKPVVLLLVTSLVLSRLDYGSATLAGIPTHTCLTGSSLCLMQQQGWYIEDGSRTVLLHCCRTCIGWVSWSE